MSRRSMFETEQVEGIRGLTSLTEPDPGEPVGSVVDVAVIGARGDGKTQFIVHAIRSLRAYAPLLEGAEHQYNRDALQVVLNAREPRPDATAPGVVPHYVFRIRPESLLSQVGLAARCGLLWRAAGLGVYALLSLLNAAAVATLLFTLRGSLDVGVLGGGCAVLVAGAAIGWIVARRRFLRSGEVYIVFWDVAGEHVYSASAADYYSFLSALVRERRRRARTGRRYAFAPVLICNPLSLGTHPEGSSYARMRQLIPLFASLNIPAPRALVAINRWSVVERVCEPDTERNQIIALIPRNRSDLDGERPATEPPADTGADPLPVVKREVLRRHCLDAEDGTEADVGFRYLRYDAGIQCEFTERPWKGAETLEDTGRRYRAPTKIEPDLAIEYIYEEGPGSFEGPARKELLGWLAALAYPPRRQRTPLASEPDPDDDEIVELTQRKDEPSAPARAAPSAERDPDPEPTASVSLRGAPLTRPLGLPDDDDDYAPPPPGGFRSGGT